MNHTMNAYSPGLENVIAARTALSTIDGHIGQVLYRGYDITELARHTSFEQVWHLLMQGELPDEAQSLAWHSATTQDTIPGVVLESLRGLPAEADLMSIVRSALSLTFSAWDLRATTDLTPAQIAADALRAAAIAPAIIAAAYRIRQGLAPVQPPAELDSAAAYLMRVTGQRPSPAQQMAINRYLILLADHGLNASTFAARSVASTGADVGSALVAGVGALSGPLHGGAPSRVLDMFDQIGAASLAGEWVEDKIRSGAKIMGFGHRVYRTYDPRALALKATAHEMNAPLSDFAETVEAEIIAMFGKLKPGREIYTNVEYWSAVVLDAVGLPRELFTPTFVASRAVGWAAHVVEQLADNRIIRPQSEYVGPALRGLPTAHLQA